MNKPESNQPNETTVANDQIQTPPSLPSDWRVDKAIKYMREQMHLNPTLAEAAAMVRLSTHRLRHLFVEHTGLTFTQYLRRLRLETARQLFETEHLTVEEVVDRVGFKGLNHFTLDFKKGYEMSPGKYRKCYLFRINSATNGH